MSNPTVNSSIPGGTSGLISALWASDIVDQSGPVQGFWDAQDATYYPLYEATGTDIQGVALGGQRGLVCVDAVFASGAYFQASDNLTGTKWEPTGSITLVALVRRLTSANSFDVFTNRDGWSPNRGLELSVAGDGAVNAFYGNGSMGGAVSTSAGFVAVNELACLLFQYDSATGTLSIRKNGGTAVTASSAAGSMTWTGHSERRASSLRNKRSVYATGAGEIYGLVIWGNAAITQANHLAFGADATALAGGSFHTAAFTGLAAAPTISAQPSNTSVTAPSTANFAASVSGTYTGLRWQRQSAGAGAWADVSGGTGGTTTSYTTGATAVNGGSFNSTDKFRLAVDWSGGVVTSDEVTLTVIAAGTAPSFSVQPSNQSATIGGTATFNFTVSGSGSLTVQTKKNGTDVGSPIAVTAGVSGNYTTPALLIGDSGDVYSFVATGNTAPTATSSNATLTVLQPIATTFTFSFNGGNSLTGLKYAVFDQVTPDLWVAPVKKASNGSSNGSGLVTIDVTGLTARRIGELGSAFVTNSDGTATGGAQAATRKAAYYVGVFA